MNALCGKTRLGKPRLANPGSASPLYPLQFEEIVQTYFFGGTQIREHFPRKRLPPLPRIAESWEVYSESVASAGPLAGKSLKELCRTYGTNLLGKEIVTRTGGNFPLMFKFLDATIDLELSVHPDETAVAVGLIPPGRSKYEAWYVLHCDPQCRFRCGTKKGCAAADFVQAAGEDRLGELVNQFSVVAGDAIYVPGGRIHGIGGRSLVAEIQDNNGDFYLFEWPHEKHTARRKRELARNSLRFARLDDNDTGKTVPVRIEENGVSHVYLAACSRFSLERYDISRMFELHLPGGRFVIVTCIAGRLRLKWSRGEIPVAPGQTLLLPACIEAVEMAPEEKASFLCSYVPDLMADIVDPLRASRVDDNLILALGGGTRRNDIAGLIATKRKQAGLCSLPGNGL